MDVLDLDVIDLPPLLLVANGTNSTQKRVARAWNSFGGLLTDLGERLKVEPYVAAAVLAVESSGRGFSGGRMIIRFENHIYGISCP